MNAFQQRKNDFNRKIKQLNERRTKRMSNW